jgi:hypothetical protein
MEAKINPTGKRSQHLEAKSKPQVLNCLTKEDFVSSFWLTRIVFIRSLSLVYQIAFISALQQSKLLVGDDGLTPMKIAFENIEEKGLS